MKAKSPIQKHAYSSDAIHIRVAAGRVPLDTLTTFSAVEDTWPSLVRAFLTLPPTADTSWLSENISVSADQRAVSIVRFFDDRNHLPSRLGHTGSRSQPDIRIASRTSSWLWTKLPEPCWKRQDSNIADLHLWTPTAVELCFQPELGLACPWWVKNSNGQHHCQHSRTVDVESAINRPPRSDGPEVTRDRVRTTIVADGAILGHINSDAAGVPTGGGYVRFLERRELPNGGLMPSVMLWVPYRRCGGELKPMFGSLIIIHKLAFEIDNRLTATPPAAPMSPE
jgi:hypothetical protein